MAMVIPASLRSSPGRTATKKGLQPLLGAGAVAPATARRIGTESSARFRLPRLTRRGKGQPGEDERYGWRAGTPQCPSVMALRRRVILQGVTDATSSHTGVMSPSGAISPYRYDIRKERCVSVLLS